MFGQKLFGNLMVGYSRFRSHIRQEAKGYEIEGNRAERQSIKRDSRYKSEMEDLSVRLSVDYLFSRASSRFFRRASRNCGIS